MPFSKKQIMFMDIHNLANDLKSGLISWREFDKKLNLIIDENIISEVDYSKCQATKEQCKLSN